MMIALIIGCEIAFWVFVLAGLACRYIFRLKKTGALLLYFTPIIDLILLIVTVVHLQEGAEASLAHGIAAVYIGVSIGFGHSMIRWTDVRFAHKFAGGPSPQKRVKFGKEHARDERHGWFRHFLSWAIGCVILYGMIFMVNVDSRTLVLFQMMRVWSVVLGIDFLISFSYTLWPRHKKITKDHSVSSE
ncbi:membrane protein [Paenibacillus sp. IHBB 10380]|nr:membrane protein [Paenibacillus sp. IHBB 10380]